MFNFFRAKTAGVTAKNVKEVLGAAALVSMYTLVPYACYKSLPTRESLKDSEFKRDFTPAGTFGVWQRREDKPSTSELKNPEVVSPDDKPSSTPPLKR